MLDGPDEAIFSKNIVNRLTQRKDIRRWLVQISDVPSKLRSVFHPFFQPKTISISELADGLRRLGLGQK